MGRGLVIQIAPQVRILVAIEAIDCRKGVDRIAQLCREKLNADPFSGHLFIFRSRRASSIRTRKGARMGDLFMSLIHTCELNSVNPFDYLIELQRHAGELKQALPRSGCRGITATR